MKAKMAIFSLALAALVPALPAAETGFENFTLSRNGGTAANPVTVSAFNSRTWTVIASAISRFSSLKPRGMALFMK